MADPAWCGLGCLGWKWLLGNLAGLLAIGVVLWLTGKR